MSEPFVGEIRMVGFNYAPAGWALCNGQALSIAQYSALFSLLGTAFGGNGTTTFNLPDLQGRVPINNGSGAGLSQYLIGQNGGLENVSLSSSQMPAHNHTVGVSNQPGSLTDPTNALPAVCNTGSVRSPTVGVLNYAAPTATGTLAPSAVSMAGGSAPHTNLQPFLTVNFIIALNGLYPPRS